MIGTASVSPHRLTSPSEWEVFQLKVKHMRTGQDARVAVLQFVAFALAFHRRESPTANARLVIERLRTSF